MTVGIINTDVGTQTPAGSRQQERGPRDCSPGESDLREDQPQILVLWRQGKGFAPQAGTASSNRRAPCNERDPSKLDAKAKKDGAGPTAALLPPCLSTPSGFLYLLQVYASSLVFSSLSFHSQIP